MIKSLSFEFNQALQNPARAFADPLDIVNHPALNVAAKFQLLEQWERDVRALALARKDRADSDESMSGRVRGAIRELNLRTDPTAQRQAAGIRP